MSLVVFDPPEVPEELREAGRIDAHVGVNIKRKYPRLRVERARAGTFVIAGGGPSIEDHLDRLRELQHEPNGICAVPGSHAWLMQNGIIPKWCILLEVNIDTRALCETPNDETTYLIASHCHKSTFDHFKGRNIVMWHAFAGSNERKYVREVDGPDAAILGGGCTSALRALNVGLVLGYRQFEMFGVDSSFSKGDERSHVYGTDYPWYVKGQIIDIEFNRHWYKTAGYLATQARDFAKFCKIHGPALDMALPPPRQWGVKVHGEGLLPDMHRHMYPHMYQEQ